LHPAGSEEKRHVTLKQLGNECRQAIVPAFREAVFDGDVAALEETRFAEPAMEADLVGLLFELDVPRKPISGTAGCCARAATGQAVAAPPSRVRNARRLMSPIRPSPAKEWPPATDRPRQGRSAAESAYRRPAGKSLRGSEVFFADIANGGRAKSARVR
jgi:hypothetical protein